MESSPGLAQEKTVRFSCYGARGRHIFQKGFLVCNVPKAKTVDGGRIGRLQKSDTGHGQKAIEAFLSKLLMK